MSQPLVGITNQAEIGQMFLSIAKAVGRFLHRSSLFKVNGGNGKGLLDGVNPSKVIVTPTPEPPFLGIERKGLFDPSFSLAVLLAMKIDPSKIA